MENKSKMKDPIKKGRKKHLRNLERNKSGRERTVVMASGSVTNKKGKTKYHANPTITFKGNEKEKPQTYREALEKGEVYEFMSKRRAERFAFGSWKKGKDKRDAMKAYRSFRKSQVKKNKEWQ